MAIHRVAALLLPLFLLNVVCLSTTLAQNQSPSAAPSSDQLLKPEQLDALVAPIALYPDNLLALVTIASTYPLEIVQADRWVKENKGLKGEELKSAVDKQAWDDSVKSLVATPEVLSNMSTKLDWTQMLGDAVLAQQPDIMDAVQRLRAKADANNKLTSTKEQAVTKKQEQGKQVIAIEQTDPNTVYVPYFDPAVAYGDWSYPQYPPYYLPWSGYIASGIIATGIAFGAGYAVGRWASGGNYWGGGVNWSNNNINVNRPRVNPLGGNSWQHNPAHRQGVRYSNGNVQQKFGNNNLRNGSQNRMDFRGRGGDQVLKPGGGQGLADRAGANRPGASGQRPSASQRPSGGRQTAAQRPSTAARGGANALGNIGSGKAANLQSARGRSSYGAGGRSFASAGGGARGGGARAGGGGARAGGGGARGGGGRRSDIALKHDIILLGHLSNGIGFYRFSYNGSDRSFVGVIAQEVQPVLPHAVVRDRDGYLRVFYDKLGVKYQTYEKWVSSGARLPAVAPVSH